MFFKDNGVKEDELQAILNYLLTMHEVTCEFYMLGSYIMGFLKQKRVKELSH